MKEELKESLKLFKLTKRNMRVVKGSGDCCCGCLYEETGGSSLMDNGNANMEEGLRSPGFCEDIQ